jgi:hypothetical protein
MRERPDEGLERAAGGVAVQALVAVGDVALRERALAGAGNAHDHHDLAARRADRRDRAGCRTRPDHPSMWKALVELAPVGVGQDDRGGARDRLDVGEA